MVHHGIMSALQTSTTALWLQKTSRNNNIRRNSDRYPSAGEILYHHFAYDLPTVCRKRYSIIGNNRTQK